MQFPSALCLALLLLAADAQAADKPNILLIMADDHDKQHLPQWGDEPENTYCIDLLGEIKVQCDSAELRSLTLN